MAKDQEKQNILLNKEDALLPLRPSDSFIFNNDYVVSYSFHRSRLAPTSALWNEQGWSYFGKAMYLHKSFIFDGDWQSHIGLDS
jgi:hypothetical protein